MRVLMLLLIMCGTLVIVSPRKFLSKSTSINKTRLAKAILALQQMLLKMQGGNLNPERREFLESLAEIQRGDPGHNFDDDLDLFKLVGESSSRKNTKPSSTQEESEKYSDTGSEDDLDDDDSMFEITPSDTTYVLVIDDSSHKEEDPDDNDDMFELITNNYMVEVKTTPMPCKETKCPFFNCSDEIVTSIKTGQVNIPSLAAYPRNACGKQYIFSNTEQTFAGAGRACCKENMRLVSIESQEEFKCLQDLYKDEMTKGSTFWSSGLYLGCPYSYRWCSSLARFSGGAAWIQGEIANPAACVALNFFNKNPAQMSFGDERCEKTFKFICEGVTQTDIDDKLAIEAEEMTRCDVPTCPILDCAVAPGSDDADDPNVDIEVACGRRYVLITSFATYVRAQENCCEMGMRLLSLETKTEQICLQEKFAESIDENRQIWTSGTDLGCQGKYRFCGANYSSMSSIDAPIWNVGEPNNYNGDEECLAMINTNGKFKLNDEDCLKRFAYICEEFDYPAKKTAGK